LFRRRFRVPFPFFVPLVEEVRQQGWLGSGRADTAGRPGIPLEATVLLVLHILGRGNALDDTFFCAGMSESTAWRVLRKFASASVNTCSKPGLGCLRVTRNCNKPWKRSIVWGSRVQ
ncbi:unnamed protein product, partial [Discosporangium mesarthrocarpum]